MKPKFRLNTVKYSNQYSAVIIKIKMYVAIQQSKLDYFHLLRMPEQSPSD